jgi:MFS family permease
MSVIKGGGVGKQIIVRVAALAGGLAMGMVNLSMVFYARDVWQLTPGRVGLLAATWCFCYALACASLRRFADRFPPRFMIAASAAIMGLSIFGILWAPSVLWVFLFYALFGGSMALFWAPLVGWLSVETEGRELSRLVSRFNMSWSLGAIASPYVAGRLYELRPTVPLMTGGVLLLVNALFVLGAAALLPTANRDRNHQADDVAGVDRSTIYRFPAWMGLTATYFGMGVLNTVFPMIAREESGFTESQVGGTLLTMGLCNFIGFILLGRFHFWHFRIAPMTGGLALRAAAFAALPWLSRTPQLAVAGMIVFGLSLSIGYSASIFHGMSGSLRKARRMGVHEALIAASLVCGSFLGGWLYQTQSSRSVYILAAGVSLVVAGAQIVCAARWNKNTGGRT